MSLQYLDIPYLYYGTPAGNDFIIGLGKCKDLSIFGLSSVQIIIENHNAHWKKIIFISILMPMIIQLITFWYWSNFVVLNHAKNEEDF